ncbi:EAL domain-containing response regulator [Pseudoalteromonas sp. CO348]|uniref:EAL domain-containing response regulator n=1 Tax=Pseudoalteromonas TaxID=53246 RepID=UPI00102385C0|nr:MULTISPECIES: EAL domain-containing response regulator [Pseudoalteromonas]MCG9768946.1 EAL domain-containing response regulator [Pseudoalteromonas piscicida]RZG00515.1 EAL domain-containing response regulator [Pseudoalteromonas sp. CO348]USE71195.1 diguanylate cyclase [Pseudoalteromonas flavipulchra]
MINEKHLIIAIDDSELILTQLQLLISNQTPCTFKGFNSGLSALESQELHQASLILLDINMPQMDGVEILRKFAELSIQAPIALLSGEKGLFIKNTAALAELHGLTIISSLEKPLSATKLKELYSQLQSQNTSTKSQHALQNYSKDEIYEGLLREEFCAYFQPKVASPSGAIIGAEVLARWHHNTDGTVPPSQFIATMEEHNLIHLLSYSLLKQTLSLLSYNRDILKSLQFSINLSVKELEDIKLPEKLESICEEYCTPTSQITLELTESHLLDNIKRALDVLLRLKLKGFKLSIDDFGTGYSSIKQLNELPFDELKIDRCFVDGCSTQPNKRVIIASTCEMAHQLGLEVVAEGVEEVEDLVVVQSYEVESVQGYYYYPPCTPSEFLQTVSESALQKSHSSK